MVEIKNVDNSDVMTVTFVTAQMVLIYWKLIGLFNVSWWVIFAPTWAPVLLTIVIAAVVWLSV